MPVARSCKRYYSESRRPNLTNKLLDMGDAVTFTVEPHGVRGGGKLRYLVWGNFLHTNRGSNDIVFRALGINKFTFFKDVLGYDSPGGDWPSIRDETVASFGADTGTLTHNMRVETTKLVLALFGKADEVNAERRAAANPAVEPRLCAADQTEVW